ncbi:hypothetical protein UPYG_G00140930 [Umbra pygmaea]|uniref:RING-type E3 ubiquitin transferase BRCA1 n=1 Tax=Umbra pygmaea TaxID=75934 RepID=A0ABD0WZL8_UMBPY
MNTMKLPKAEDVKRGISVIWETLQCPICLDLMSTPVSTKCDHQFCKFCIMKLLDSSRRKEANCPVCNSKVTKRSLQESPGFQRLVEGLQNLVQAYEHDTGTNYFTGMYQMSQMSVIENMQKKTTLDVSSEDVWVTEHSDDENKGPDELPMSCSSTIAAKDGFAKLMGFQDSCSVLLDEGDDSDLPPASEKETSHSKDITSTIERQKPALEPEIPEVVQRASSKPKKLGKNVTVHPTGPSSHPEEPESHPVRRSLRNNKRQSMSPTKITDHKQKKSLDKVSEWLMNISPTEENSEIVKNTEVSHDFNDSASQSGSSSHFSPLKDNLMTKKQSPNQEEHGRCLEDQVFGAVYKRDRRGNRSFSPQNRVIAAPPCSTKEFQVLKKVPQKRRSIKLTPSDFVKKPRSDEIDDSVLNAQPEMTEPHENSPNEESKNAEHTVNDMTEDLNSYISDQGEKLDDLSDDDVKISPVFSVPPRKTKRKRSTKMEGKWQDVNGDLPVQEIEKLMTNKQKNASNKKRGNAKREKSKAAKITKPLVLVGVRDSGSDSVLIPKSGPTGQIEVHIECYPSSEDQGTPITRRTRSSQQFQLFKEEVQGGNTETGSARSIKLSIPDSDSNKIQQLEEVEEEPDKIQNSQNLGKSVRKNGCVLIEDIGGIDNMDSSEKTSCETIENQECNSAVVPASPCHIDISGSATMVPGSRSPPVVGVLCSVAERMNQNDTVMKPSNDLRSNVPQETSASQDECINMEDDDRNDSELDTEQLLKSFKTTKRKSFHLGSPSNKRNSFSSNKENTDLPKTTDDIDMETGKQQECSSTLKCSMFQQEFEKRVENENSCYSDMIPPSSSPNNLLRNSAQKNPRRIMKSIVTRPLQEVVKPSNLNAGGKSQEQIQTQISSNSGGSVLSPNTVAKMPMETPNQAVDSGLLFLAFSASEEDLPDLTPEASKQLSVLKTRQSYSLEDNTWKSPTELDISQSEGLNITVEPDKILPIPTIENVANTDSSLTPDNILLPVTLSVVIQQEEGVKGSGEKSSNSSMPNSLKQRKRKKAQRLDSSSLSECSGEEEELLPLTHIFRPSACLTEEESVSLLEDNAREPGSIKDAKDGHQEGSPSCPSPDWIHSSQASVDLFDTPVEDTAGVSGLTQESSQFSSEFIATQQKVAMQEELRRLERMMALVSEALQEKEKTTGAKVNSGPPSGPTLRQPGKSTGISLQMTGDPVTGKRSATREDVPDVGENAPPGSQDCNDLGPTPTTPLCTTLQEHGGTRAERFDRRSGRSLRSSKLKDSPNQVSLRVTRGSGANNPSSAGLEVKDTCRVIQPANTHLVTQALLCEPVEKLVLVGSGLKAPEQSMLKKFAKQMGGSVSSQVTSETTHIVMSTDGDLVCERTLKYFLGIAGRKWVVSFLWILESFKQGKVLSETQFEVRGDVVNGSDHRGPMRARTTGDNNLLMKDYEICFQGPFTDMTIDQMDWMVELCGATVVKKPNLFTGKQTHQLVLVQPSSHQLPVNYQAFQEKATVISRGWLLDTVATYTLQSIDDYRTLAWKQFCEKEKNVPTDERGRGLSSSMCAG